jgi:hypothetical protein
MSNPKSRSKKLRPLTSRGARNPAAAPPEGPAIERLAVTIEECQQMLGVRRTSVYFLIGQQKLAAYKIGRRTVVTTESIRTFLKNLAPAQIAAPKPAA